MIERIKAWARRLKRELVAVYLAVSDPRTPWFAKLVGALVVAYAFSPIDIIPDFIPVLGYLDDAILVPAGVWLVLRLIPAAVMEDARERADQQLRQPKPVSLAGAAVVVAVWVAIAALSARWFLGGIGVG